MGGKRKGKKRRAEKYKIASVAWYFIGWLRSKKVPSHNPSISKKRNEQKGTRYVKRNKLREQAKSG